MLCYSFFFGTDSDSGKKSWTAKLGSVDFTLAFVLVLDAQGSSQGHAYQSLRCLPNPGSLGKLVQDFSGWLVWGISGEVPAYSFAHSTEIALCLLRHRQYHAVEVHIFLCFFYDLSGRTVVYLANKFYLLVIEFAHDRGCTFEE